MMISIMNVFVFLLMAPVAGGAGEQRWTVAEQELIDFASIGPMPLNDSFEAWQSAYHDDWSFWRIGDETVRARGDHMKLVKDYMEGGAEIISFELAPVDAAVRGDSGMLRFNAVETIRQADGTVRVVSYSSASFYAREEGEWKILASNLYYPPVPDAE